MTEPKCKRRILLPGSVGCPEAWENVLQFPFIMFRNKEKRKKLLLNSRFGLKILCPLKRKETCLYKPSLPSLPTPHHLQVLKTQKSVRQKREKILELKKKEKLLQEKLLKKVEELKKICLREAVSVFCFGEHFKLCLTVPARVSNLPLGSVLFYRSSQAKCPRSILWM